MILYYFPIAQNTVNKTVRDFFQRCIYLYMYVHIFDYFSIYWSYTSPWNGLLNILLEGLNRFHGAIITLNSDVDQDTYIFSLLERPLTYQCIVS